LIVLDVFTDIVLPVVIVIILGMALRFFRKTSVEPISQAALYLFSPALVFLGLAQTDLPLESMGKIVAFGLLFSIAMYLIARASGFALRLDRNVQSSLLMSVLFMNAGNMSLPIVKLAFGDAGLDRALVFFALIALLVATFGVYIAARGNQGGMASLKAVAVQPIAYAATAGLALNVLDVSLPELVLRPTELLANAAFPAMLLVLGGTLVGLRTIHEWKMVTVATALRLWVGMGIGFLLLKLLGVDELTRNVLLVQASAPTAVIVIVLATEFNARPAMATGVVVVSTILSMPTLTILLAVLTG
jgi:predicted permease